MSEEDFAAQRQALLEEIAIEAHLVAAQTGRAAFAPKVMEVMGRVPRHAYVPLELQPYAYLNRPLPIGFEKTISQPFIVALMTDLLQLSPDDAVLEVGTGLGYQAAILAALSRQVYSIEIIEELAVQARQRLRQQGCGNVEVRIGNGCHGWPEHAPFDKILVAAAPELIPVSLLNQLKAGGRMTIPAGLAESQQLLLVEKGVDGMIRTVEVLPVRFSQLEETADEG
jgi:protein-L-isoaspartate(D-aspartate) O-methyltransferase